MALWSKFCIPFFLHFWDVEVLITYHAKFYSKIRTGSRVILTPPSLDSKMTKYIKKELTLVKQIGSDVIFSSLRNIMANFLCNSHMWDLFGDLFWCLQPLKCLCAHCISKLISFTRAVHVKGTERRIKPGSVLTIWKVTAGSISDRSPRRLSKFSVLVNTAIFIQQHAVTFKSFTRLKSQYIFVSYCQFCITLVSFEFLQ